MPLCMCGNRIEKKPGRGRKRSYCSDACKLKAYRKRAKRNEILIRNDCGSGGCVNTLFHGDALTVLKTIPSESVDLLVTDPPYGYSFMGKDWDKAVPSVEIWRECLRVLKPGAFAFIMSSPRQDVLSHMIVRLSSAGFQTDFTSLYWAYASGFPKAMNISKMVDKKLGADREIIEERMKLVNWHNSSYNVSSNGEDRRNRTKPATDQAKALDGSYAGFQPKPAVEVILVAMKPLSEKTFVDQALKNGKGVTWLDNCRIPYESDSDKLPPKIERSSKTKGIYGTFQSHEGEVTWEAKTGRFPANLLVSDDILNDGRVTQSRSSDYNFEPSLANGAVNFLGDKAIKSGIHYPDAGSFSRYFDLDKWAQQTVPFLLVPKASKGEKGTENTHPTVKPLKLMAYLITLGSRPGDMVLDPFMGSGTSCVAASLLGRRYTGIELQAEYVNIAKARLTHPSLPPVS